MAKLNVRTAPIVPKGQVYPPGVGAAPALLRALGYPWAQALAASLSNIDGALTQINGTLRKAAPVTDSIVVVNENSKVVAALGPLAYGGVVTNNYFSEIHAGDPLGTGDPAEALFNANADGSVVIGQNGWITVHDPYGAEAAWIGTQWDTLAVTLAANNGSGLIRLTVAGHPFATSDVLLIRDVGGVPNATGQFTITKIDANRFDLQASVWDGTYTSGGTVTRLLHVTGAVNNGAGLIRLTVTAHGCETGDRANVGLVGGVPNATGQWTLTVISANTIDLIGSTWGGTYTTGGTFIRYFAGMMAQTFSIGAFTNYKLRAFADGSLKIKNAYISIAGVGGITITGTADFVINIDSGVGFQSLSATGVSALIDQMGVAVYKTLNLLELKEDRIQITSQGGGAHDGLKVVMGGNAAGSWLAIYDSLGANALVFDSETGGLALYKSLPISGVGNFDMTGTLKIHGATSGYVGFAVPAVAGGTTYTLPAADGTPGQVLKTDGSAVLGFVTVYTAGGTDVAVTDGGTGTSTGSITGTGALTFAAGGSNQPITLTPSGSGVVIISNNGSALPAGLTGTVAQFAGRDNVASRVIIDGFGNSTAGVPVLDFRRAHGTVASPSALTADTTIGQHTWLGYGATAYTTTNRAILKVCAAENWTDSAQGTYFSFLTTAIGAVASSERFRIHGAGVSVTGDLYVSGDSGFGVATPGYKVDVLGDINTSTLFRVAGTQVVGARQADPGVPVFVTFADVATWCGNLRNALKATTGHGLF